MASWKQKLEAIEADNPDLDQAGVAKAIGINPSTYSDTKNEKSTPRRRDVTDKINEAYRRARRNGARQLAGPSDYRRRIVAAIELIDNVELLEELHERVLIATRDELNDEYPTIAGRISGGEEKPRQAAKSPRQSKGKKAPEN